MFILFFLIVGIVVIFVVFCYVEFLSWCFFVGSVYYYVYICVGEGYVLNFIVWD